MAMFTRVRPITTRVLLLGFWISLSTAACQPEAERRPPRRRSGPRGAPRTAVFALYTDIKDWDPASGFTAEIDLFANVYETLVRYQPPGSATQLAPGLATDWSASDDGTRWTFHLRRGVRFHDGSAVRRRRRQGRARPHPQARPGRRLHLVGGHRHRGAGARHAGDRDGVPGADRPHRLVAVRRLHLLRGRRSRRGRVVSRRPRRRHRAVPRRRLAARPTGRARAQRRVLGRLGRRGRRGAFDRVLLRAVQSPTTQLQMLRGGDADVISIAPVDMLVRALEEPGIEATFAPSWVNVIVQLNTRSYPTDNVLFRRALTHAWDYDAINRYIYYGRSRRAHGIIPDGMWGYDPDLGDAGVRPRGGAAAARSLRRAARGLAPHAHLQQRVRGVQEHRQGLPAQPGEDRRAAHAAPGSVGDDLERGQEPAHRAAGVPHGVVADLSVAGGLADGTLQHREVAAVQPLPLQQPGVRSTGGRGGGARGGRARPGDREVPARAGAPGRAGGGDLRRGLRRSRHPSQRPRRRATSTRRTAR